MLTPLKLRQALRDWANFETIHRRRLDIFTASGGMCINQRRQGARLNSSHSLQSQVDNKIKECNEKDPTHRRWRHPPAVSEDRGTAPFSSFTSSALTLFSVPEIPFVSDETSSPSLSSTSSSPADSLLHPDPSTPGAWKHKLADRGFGPPELPPAGSRGIFARTKRKDTALPKLSPIQISRETSDGSSDT